MTTLEPIIDELGLARPALRIALGTLGRVNLGDCSLDDIGEAVSAAVAEVNARAISPEDREIGHAAIVGWARAAEMHISLGTVRGTT